MTEDFQHDNKWTSLPYPFGQRLLPVMINGDEFIVLRPNAIFKFNVKSNKWIKMFDVELLFDEYSCTFNKHKNIIYVWTQLYVADNETYIIDLNKKEIKTTTLALSSSPSTIIYTNNTIHIITSHQIETAKHYEYNTETKQNNIVYEFEEFRHGIEGAGFIHLKYRKTMLLLGGWDANSDSLTSNSIYEYSLLTKKWNKLNIKLPLRLSHFPVVSTRYNQYVIILCGWINSTKPCGDIYVMDMKQSKWMKSEIKCPNNQKGYAEAIITDNIYDDELLAFGFIRICFKLKTCNDIQSLISKWVCNQSIHILQNNRNTSNHWKIDVDHIINACNDIK
eukprot:137570_1